MGEFVKQILEDRHINASSVAKAMGVKSTSMPSYFKSKSITEDVLVRMTNVLQFDLLGMVRAEQARRQGRGLKEYGQQAPATPKIEDPGVRYNTAQSGANGKGLTLVIDMSEYTVESQLRILNFVNQQDKKSDAPKAAGR